MITLTTVVVFVVVVAAVVWLMKPAAAAANEPLTQPMMRALFEALLYQGQNGGQLSINSRTGDARLVFEKYIGDGNEVGIRALVPVDSEHDDIRRVFVEELARRGIPHDQSRAPRPQLMVDVGNDLGLAHFLASIYCERVRGEKLDRDYVGYFNDRVLTVNLPALTGIKRE